ncbi:MAG: S8 family peptidase [Lachnospiraceae bacterium]|nr:S8 family peptidase [Lachnospiraceae bacterium]
MEDQKLETTLNLALDTGEAERARSLNLNTGFEEDTRSWELIVKYNGSLEAVKELDPGIRVTPLMNGFAILLVPEALVEKTAALPEIEFVEKPKRLSFAMYAGRAASCMEAVQTAPFSLTGRDVLVGIADSGIDYTLADFRNEDGSTRILRLWDQTALGKEDNSGYGYGHVYTEAEINEALTAGSRERQRELVPEADTSGHGTAVAGIAAGNGRGAGDQAELSRGIAWESDLLIVKLGTPRPNSFPRTTQLMAAVDFLVREAIGTGRPLALNLSFGNSYGSHDGTSLLDVYLDAMAMSGRFSFAAGSGNEGAMRGHARLFLEKKPGGFAEVLLAVGEYEPSLNIQIWKSFLDTFELRLVAPTGQEVPVTPLMQPGRARFGSTNVLIYYGEPGPFSRGQEIYLDFISESGRVIGGLWRLRFYPRDIRDGQVDLWLPGGGVLNANTGFLVPDPNTTLTIPSTASGVITVAAYDAARQVYADFSGRGFLRSGEKDKPDLAAPGVGIRTTAVGGGYTEVTGTSFATPFVAGSAALMMEWGIVRGNDPYLYGEKVKAYLQRGARPLPGLTVYPNPQVGWGTLCLKESLPV